MSRPVVAVTGATGFIGRHVLAELNKQDSKVIAITRNASALSDLSPSAQIVETDLARCGQNIFKELGSPETLIHLAWDGLPNYNSPHHLKNELPAQYRFLSAMVEGGLSALVVAGTCLEYGMQSGELSEDQVTAPGNPYAQAKDSLRQRLQAMKEKTPFTLTWARLFYMYGEGQGSNSLYPQLKTAVAAGDKRFRMSGGKQLRDYLPVEEVARLIVVLANARIDAGCVNVCSGKPVTVRELVDKWIASNGWSIQPDPGHFPYPDYEPMEFWGKREKLDRVLASL